MPQPMVYSAPARMKILSIPVVQHGKCSLQACDVVEDGEEGCGGVGNSVEKGHLAVLTFQHISFP